MLEMPETLEALVCGKDWLIKIPNNEGMILFPLFGLETSLLVD